MKISYILHFLLYMLLIGFLTAPVVHAQQTGLVSMDFDNVDLKAIIKFMSELTGKNFIIDNRVKGTATVISPTKIPVEEAYKVLESILVVNGYTTVPSDNIIKVIPLNEAKQLNIETDVGKSIAGKNLKDRMITQIVPLEYADVDKVKAILVPYISTAGYIASYLPTNTLILTETSSNLTRLLKIIKDLDKKSVSSPKNAHVYYVQDADAVQLARLLSKVYLQQGNKKGHTGKLPTIVADTSSNSLIILASPQEYAFLKGLLHKLDKSRPQVLVESVIAEVSLQKTMELGLELAAAGGIIYGSPAGFGGVQTQGAVKNILTGGGLSKTAAGAVEGTTQKAGITMPNLGMLITASNNTNDINILSTPQILATDNVEAKISVGKRLAFIKNIQVTPEGTTVRTFDYKDVGILLKIVPHITDNGFVRMDIIQQVEDVLGENFPGAVETSKRAASTTVTVRDNSTIVIGGLLVKRKKNSIQKVPLLGDIPVLNILFKRKQTKVEKMNLFLFITPHIIRSQNNGAR